MQVYSDTLIFEIFISNGTSSVPTAFVVKYALYNLQMLL